MSPVRSLLAACVPLITCWSVSVSAQAPSRPLEAGVHAAALRLGEFDRTEPGLGGRLTWDLSPRLAVEGEFTVFPRDRRVGSNQVIRGDARKNQGLFGVKAGYRSDRWGVFGKVRPGFVRFEKFVYRSDVVCIAIFPPPAACLTSFTAAALDLGGVVEVYPSNRLVVRLDAGSTYIGSSTARSGRPNLQVSGGVGFRWY
jgi:hypothetical protein